MNVADGSANDDANRPDDDDDDGDEEEVGDWWPLQN
jgi:hypothetical protein